MSATVQLRGVGAGHGDRELFANVDLVVAPGDVIGLVGPNGAGKSTLLRIIGGRREPDAGTVSVAPAHAQLGYLPQEVDRRPGESVWMRLERTTGVAAAQVELDAAADAMGREGDAAADRYSLALEHWLALGAADLEARVGTAFDAIGLDIGLDASMSSLSGGQAARVGLAALLLSRFDMFLLDEPTNDLDADGLAVLEDFVHRVEAPVVVVSHDREFLSRTINAVVEIDRSLQRVATYGGSYDSYLEERTNARRRAHEQYDEYVGRRDALEARARKQRAWMEKGVRNARRKATDPDKHIKAFRTQTSEKQAAKARQSERMIERLEVVEEPRKEWQLQMSIEAAPRSGAIVAAAHGAVIRYGSFVLGPVDLQLNWRDRVAITGPNGAGKTTLLSVMLGRTSVDEGSIDLGAGVRIGEVDQARRTFEGEEPLARAFAHQVPDWSTAEVRTLLAKFGLGTEHVDRSAAQLSPGERTRAALALLQARGVNLLVLDEPTNHLDLPAIEQLEAALDAFDGTILLVTHDRRMLETVRITRRWHVEAGQVVEVDAD